MAEQKPGQAGQQMPKEELAASGSGHLLLTDFDDEDAEDADESMMSGGAGDMTMQGGRRRMFMKELRCTLFGYGDDPNPYTETVEFLDDLVLEFISDMTQKGMEIGRSGRVQVEDIIFLVRKHPRMYARVRDLLTMNEELKKARKAFDEIKYVQGTN
jgi:transcription initiation factor TFIID subunit 13